MWALCRTRDLVYMDEIPYSEQLVCSSLVNILPVAILPGHSQALSQGRLNIHFASSHYLVDLLLHRKYHTS